MTAATVRSRAVARAHASGQPDDVVRHVTHELRSGLAGRPAAAVLWFASSAYEPAAVAGPLTASFPEATVIGCSTAGEFTDEITGTGSVTAVALSTDTLLRVSAALGDLHVDPAAGVDTAVARVEADFGQLRHLDAARHLGIVLIDGLHGDEELVNARLGNAAPLLDIVGGSAGDDLAFRSTWVALGDQVSDHGMVLLMAETAAPFRIVKTCSFTPSGTRLRITKADVPHRTVLEFDGRPAVAAYADALGVAPEQVDNTVFMSHPLGLMIDGLPWIRSPQGVTPEGHLRFYAQVMEGADVDVMQPGNLADETADAIAAAVADLGGHSSGGIMFNCILRRLEIDANDLAGPFLSAFDGIPLAGFHTYGETWLGHVNQTLTGVLFS